jgi:hypothetical protein
MHTVVTGSGQNNGNTRKLRNRISVGYAERTQSSSTLWIRNKRSVLFWMMGYTRCRPKSLEHKTNLLIKESSLPEDVNQQL